MRLPIDHLKMACDDAGAGPAVLLLHGYPLCRRMWQPQVAALVEMGYRAVVPDLRGFGDTGASEGPCSMDLYADDVVRLLDVLEIDRAVIGGMSMGGYVVLNLLARYPGRFLGAGLFVTRAAADDEPGRLKRTELASSVRGGRPEVVAESFESVLFAPSTPKKNPEMVAEVRRWMLGTDPRGLVGGLMAMRERADYVDRLTEFDVPTLVVGAGRDQAIPAEHSRVLAERLPRATYHLIEDGGHMVNLEQPETFNACLLGFLQGLELK